jgi:hypothetical protein
MMPVEMEEVFMDLLMTTNPLSSSTPTPSSKKRSFSSMDMSPPSEEDWSDHDAYKCERAARVRLDDSLLPFTIEPLREPAANEIPMADLMFWLGDALGSPATCQCTSHYRRVFPTRPSNPPGHSVFLPTLPYMGLSPKIPVIPLPRIEGLN